MKKVFLLSVSSPFKKMKFKILLNSIQWILLFLLLIKTSAHPSTADDTVYTSQLEKCLKNIELIPANVSANFDIKIEKNHIELTIHNDDKFDYYEMNLKGYCCYRATGLNVIPARNAEEQKDCDE